MMIYMTPNNKKIIKYYTNIIKSTYAKTEFEISQQKRA